MAFTKQTWLVQPLIIPFLTPMVPSDEKQMGMIVLTAPVNHNKLNQSKGYSNSQHYTRKCLPKQT
jgi:hypothetical protein